MDKTPVSKCKSAARRLPSCRTDVLKKSSNQSTCSSPTADTLNSENDYSFTQIASTQEGCDNIDVVWDWNSPQAKQRPKKAQKRLPLPQSPKIPIKRHPSNHSIQDFEKLREELKLLRDEIARPEHEELLQLSPVEEAEYKSIHDKDGDAYLNAIEQGNFGDAPPPSQELFNDDLFNDSFDNQLVQFSQRVESDLFSNTLKKSLNGESRDINNIKTNCKVNTQPSNRISIEEKTDLELQSIANDSLDFLLREIECKNDFREVSNSHTSIQTKTGKVEFHRTKSFEMSALNNFSGKLQKTKLDEIERKRKEALAKLESKKKQGSLTNSPIQCSIEEIEKKRLQALAKREAKRQQDLIEQKRQEAIKRLELNRKKNASTIKSSLCNRLN